MKPDLLTENFHGRGPLIHVVLDGWGVAPQGSGNAIQNAQLPVMNHLLQTSPYTELWTHGHYVGLPGNKDLGGSEVGHMTMGAGEVIEQGPSVISNLIKSGDFIENDTFQKLLKNCVQRKVPLHLLGLLSDGNIHSHIDHFETVIHQAFKQGIQSCFVHALLDGRDVAVQSAIEYTDRLEQLFRELKSQNPSCNYAFASGGGRETITMDRDHNWQKIEKGWKVHVHGESKNRFDSISNAVHHFRKQIPDIIDQDLPGFVITRNGEPIGPIQNGHSLIFMNFRGDRAIQFSEAILKNHFHHFDRHPRPQIQFASMMQYDLENFFPPEFLVGTPKVNRPIGRRLVELGLKQFRLTETQKFPHVTFFYNGGYRNPLDQVKETYHLIASDKISSFADKPAMKAAEIGTQAVEFILSGEYHYGLINLANADMVGHTGKLQETIVAVESVDKVLGQLMKTINKCNGLMVITADHGNAEEMQIKNPKTGEIEISAKHSLNPVPFLIYDPFYDGGYHLKPYGKDKEHNLSHIAATNFILMGMKVPDDIAPPLFV